MKSIYIFYFCLLVSQTIQGYFKYKKGTKINISKNFDLSIKKYDKPLKKSYNVYYLLIDSYPSFESLETIHKIDNSSFNHWLKKKGFFTNENAYSNYGRTYTSMQATFQMKHNYYKDMDYYTFQTPISRYVMAGANPVMGRFYNNGFSVYINPLDDEEKSNWNGIVKEKIDIEYRKYDIYWFIKYLNSNIEMNSGFNHKVKTEVMKIVPFDSTEDKEAIDKDKFPYFMKLKNINQENKMNKKFIYIHFHLQDDYMKCKEGPIRESYIKQISCNNQDLKKSINYILKNESDPIIILQADHGSGSKPNVEGNVILKRFGILFSVRWPEPCKYLGKEKYTPINLFPRVFACLNGKKPDYHKMVKDDSYLIGSWSEDKNKKPDEVFKIIENNQILPEWK